jgi:hypothetical protein
MLPAIVKFLQPQRAAAGPKQTVPRKYWTDHSYRKHTAKLTNPEFLGSVHRRFKKVYASETEFVSVLRLKVGKHLISSPI